MKTICQVLLECKSREATHVAIQNREQGIWRNYKWSEYYNEIAEAACSLIAMGIKPKDRVAIMSETNFQWSICDYAILGVGAVTIPIYQTVTPEDLEYMLNNSKAKVLFIENSSIMKTFIRVKDRCPHVEKVISFASGGVSDLNIQVWSEFKELGKQSRSQYESEFETRALEVKLADMATIIYTSGTTGQPKGVVLTHTQIVSEVDEAFRTVGVVPEDVSLSFLPYAHVLGRIEHWGHMFHGFTMAYAESIDKMRFNLKDIRPTILVAVPRIFEKIYGAIWAQMEGNVVRTRLFRWALAAGLKAGDYKLRREPLPPHLIPATAAAKKIVLTKVKEAFGGRLRFAISGGAPLAREIALFFHACDVLILEGYGLTETTAAICVNTPYDYRFGSVGKPVGDVKLKIAEDGEILVKSNKVMREYFENPEATQEVLTDGWFHTGDIGEIMDSGDLRITDRKKDLIKTAGGKYVAPQRLENLLKTNALVSNVLIHGDQKKYIVALITLDKNHLLQIAKDKNIQYKDFASLTQNSQVLEMMRKFVAQTNTQLASFETIKRFAILPEDFTVEAGELTPSLKVKRKFLDKKFKSQIESLYS